MRGIAAAMVDLDQFNEAEAWLHEALEIEPTNEYALNELDYIAGIRRGAAHFGIAESQFYSLQQSYQTALSTVGKKTHWNADIDDFGRSLGALTEADIVTAQTNFGQAIWNRIAVRLASDNQTEAF